MYKLITLNSLTITLLLFNCQIIQTAALQTAKNSRELIRAIRKNKSKTVQILVAEGIKINFQYLSDYYCDTPLIMATRQGQADIVKILLTGNANIDAHNRFGYTALMVAAEYGYNDIVKILIDSGADPNKKNLIGQTAKELTKNEIIKNYLNY